MLTPDTLVNDPQRVEIAWQAHLTRTRDRITAFRAKLDAGVRDDGERQLIEEAIQHLEGQLERSAPATQVRPQETSLLVSMIQGLKAEMAELKVRFLPGTSPESVPPTPELT
ncbi:MAG TPA: hypothetical protein DCP69_04530 [Candidatus Omnitrophica bacterium]|nr:hypothetical protein [Candidatus Omnitrophota bacterium]